MRVYYAIVEQEGDSAYGIRFPDFPTVFSAADEESDIVANAVDALEAWAEDEELPRPSPLHAIQALESVRLALAGSAVLVRVPLPLSGTARR